MAQYVLAHADDLAGKIALSVVSPDKVGETHWTYAQLDRSVRGLAGGLLAQGLVPGDRVLLRLGNTVDFPLAFLGAIAAGLVPVPTSSQLTVPEITKLAAIVTPAVIIADKGISLPLGSAAPAIDTSQLHKLASYAPGPVSIGRS